MDCYIEFHLLPDPEFPAPLLMNAIYSKLHKALFDLKTTSIGVSFPHCKKTLGSVLRLHGSSEDLQRLQQRDWMGAMRGYCASGQISVVPDGVRHRRVFRQQTNMSEAKLKRLLKRGSIDDAAVNQYRQKMLGQHLSGPYVELRSASNGQQHRRYIELGALLDKPVAGDFDYFGLSKTATVPWF